MTEERRCYQNRKGGPRSAPAVLLSLLALLLTPPAVFAAITEPVPSHRMFSLRAAFDEADRDNKEILVASSSLPISQAAIVIAKAIPNPIHTTTYGWGRAYNYIVAGNGEQIGWSEEIQVAGKRSKKAAVAQASYLQTALQLQAVRFDVHNRMRRAYAELAAAHAYADLIEAQREVNETLLSISEKRFSAGKAPGSEVLQARLSVLQFDAQRNLAQGRLIQDTAQLAFLLGQNPRPQDIFDIEENELFNPSGQSSVLVPNTDRPLPALAELLPTAWQQRKDLRAAIQAAEVDRKALTLAKTQRIPDPTVGFNYYWSNYNTYQFGFFDPAGVLPYLQGLYPNLPQLIPSFHNPNPPAGLVKNLYAQSIISGVGEAATFDPSSNSNGIPDIRQDKVPSQPGYQLVVQQETPIFYQYQGQVNQAKATWLQQLRQNEQLRAQIAADIVTAYEALLAARANLKMFQTHILPVAARVSLMTKRGYELGKMDLATTMLAQLQYRQLLSAYFDGVVAYQNAWADMEKAVGVPLTL